jgi:hypothetical protein
VLSRRGPYDSPATGCPRLLHAALDDASRLIPHAQFYLNQGLDAFLDCLRQAIALFTYDGNGNRLTKTIHE